MLVLILNSGSSSLKFSLYESEGEQVRCEGLVDWSTRPAKLVLRRPGRPETKAEWPLERHGDAVTKLFDLLTTAQPPLIQNKQEIAAVGHRVVHGGAQYTAAVRVTAEVKARLAEIAELAPLQNPANLEGIKAAEAALPGVPHVAAFDTGFHATLPEVARVYPVPYEWYTEWGVRRYGFHGLSHGYCAQRAPEFLGKPIPRLLICHLGNGSSVAAVRDGSCVDTSMGFTPLEGLMMGTRSGSVDPGLLLYVLRRKGLTPDQLDHVLNHESGLLGVSGIAADLRQVEQASRDNDRARLALELFCRRVRQTVGSLTTSLGGLDALVFTAGIGEHSATVRASVCAGLEHLGIALDSGRNDACQPDADISTPGSAVRVLVLATREDLMIVRATVQLLTAPAA